MQKVILIILDGYGLRDEEEFNAVKAANTPTLDALFRKYPNNELNCSGLDVGLPEGMMGNSEVGHLNIGAGRVVKQMLVEIDKAIADGTFYSKSVFNNVMNIVKERGSSLHLIGLISDGGVHSRLNHLYALLKMAKEHSLRKVYIHAFTDGRDTPPNSGERYLREIIEKTDEIGIGEISTVIGRYYSMDRDNRWDRTDEAFRAMVHGEGEKFSSAEEVIEHNYGEAVTDEFIKPSSIFDGGKPTGMVRDGDGVISFNFRADRMRQLTAAFTDSEFSGFDKIGLKVEFASMTMYSDKFYLPFAFEPEPLANIFGDAVSRAGLSQLRVAETEKYAHVTYFFNGGNETPFEGEDRVLINSPKVATYDLKPEMSAENVTDTTRYAIEDETYDLIVLNYANCDMVGHTGSYEAAVIAVETVDDGLSKLVPAMLESGGVCLITADHGNAELMFDEKTKTPHTTHTTNPVPVILAGAKGELKLRKGGRLADIAPTILELLNVDKPDEMTGHSLISKETIGVDLKDEEKVLDGV